MTEEITIPVTPSTVDRMATAFRDVGCALVSVEHQRDESLSASSGPYHSLKVVVDGWGRALNAVRIEFSGSLSRSHLLMTRLPCFPGGGVKSYPAIDLMGEDDFGDLAMDSVSLYIDEQGRRRDLAAAHGILIPMSDASGVGPMIVDHLLGSYITRHADVRARLPDWVRLSSESHSPVDFDGPAEKNGTVSTYHLMVDCPEVPRLLVSIPLAHDADGCPTVRYDGFTMRLEQVGEWPLSLVTGIVGRRAGEIMEIDIAPIADRIISEVVINSYGGYDLLLEPDAVSLAGLIDGSVKPM